MDHLESSGALGGIWNPWSCNGALEGGMEHQESKRRTWSWSGALARRIKQQ